MSKTSAGDPYQTKAPGCEPCHAKQAFFEPCQLHAGCKINAYLRITGMCQGQGNDAAHKGWHTLDTLFVPLAEPHDTLFVRAKNTPGLQVRCDTAGIDLESNTLTAAYALYAKHTGFAPALEVALHKGIPHGAGLGGGSSDAAVLLEYLDACNPCPLGISNLMPLAVQVGADVPFFLMHVPCVASGIGDKLVRCERTGLEGMGLVLLCPPVHVSTLWAYKRFDEANCASHTLTRFFKEGTTPLSCSSRFIPWLENSFEDVVFQVFPQLLGFKAQLLQKGALAAVMSGSGAALFGLFRKAEQAHIVAEFFRQQGVVAYDHVIDSCS